MVQLIKITSRKAQFFIITAVLVGGSLGITANVLENYNDFDFDEISSSASPAQYQSLANSVDSLWYEEAWQYERQFLIREQSDHRVTSFPVRLEMDTETLIDAGKMQSDCDDLRVVIDGVSVPYQIENGTCDTQSTDIWMLASLGPLETKEAHVYYGNPEVADTTFESPFTVNENESVVENSMLRIRANNTASHGLGIVELFLTGTADQLVDEGVALFKGDDMPSWDNMTVTETGPVYTSVSFGPNHNYTMFAKNQFLRRDEGVALTGDETLFYSTADEPLDRWEAADGATADVSDDTFSGAIGDTAPYVAAYDSEDDLSLTMTTNASIDQYQTASGPDYEMGLTGPEPVTRVDYLINNERPRSFEAAIHNEPPETSLGTETQGTFFPMNGWQHKATVRIEEDAGLALEQYPAEVDLRLGRYDVRTDCRDIIAVRDNTIVPHEIVGDCNSNGFKEPTDHTARWPLDAGEGTRINGTDDQYNGQTQGDPVWEPGRFGFGLQLDAGGHVLIDEGPVLALDRSPFTVSLWIRPTAVQEGDLFSLPQNNPTFRISQLDGDYKLEGVYRNESDHEFTVSSDTVVSDMTNSWHHVAFRHDEQADTISVFVDGTRENQTTVNGRMTQSVENIRIGDGFVGAIDEVKLYKRALTDEIIRDQQELYTTFSMAVNVTPATTQFVDIYLGSTTVFDTPTPTYVDTSPADDPTVDVATVAQQDAGWTRLQSHLDTVGTTGTVDLQRNGQCSDLRYDTSRFLLEQTLC